MLDGVVQRFNGVTSLVADDTLTLRRLVGFLEYMRALKHLEAFLKDATPAELAAAETIVADRHEFSIFVNLSRLIQSSPTALEEEPRVPGDDFQRRGLSWLTAIARLEVQSMLAAFSDLRDPFSWYPPTDFDREEYMEVLLDGTRSHFWLLSADSELAEVLSASLPDSSTLAHLRRLVMLRGFISTVLSMSDSNLSSAQLAELQDWDAQIEELRQQLVAKIQSAFVRTDVARAVAEKLASQCRRLCQRLLTR